MSLHTLPDPSAAIPATLPNHLDCETAMLLRSFLVPLIDVAQDWADLQDALGSRGYDVTFREGHMVILDRSSSTALCTGRSLGRPLQSLVERFGRPCIKAHRGGISGDLSV